MPKVTFEHDILPLKNQLFRLALRIVQSREEAEDIVQDTLLKAWNRRASWDKIENMESFLMTSCRNLALDRLKRSEHQNISLDDEQTALSTQISSHTSIEEQLLRQDRIKWVHTQMNRLPEKQRTCMQLRDVEGKAYKEIAEILGLTEEQVKVNIFRARQTIKEKIKQQ